MREARPDLGERLVSQEAVYEARAKVVGEVCKQMEDLGISAPVVEDEHVVSDYEYDEDESEDESDDEDQVDAEVGGNLNI